ncbi:hypothetical protein [Rufibacter hautae]|uniref:Uncharacterized protein n=1 Tax=Rufibacter hautae TaxID=2595005 RepID=A0A5B6TVM0_9BACT|nr:hypothetical protein [Rufibacter hautae]KAA3440618.1 hypothetical protein FOA19_08195 [Rufibacter hautae]
MKSSVPYLVATLIGLTMAACTGETERGKIREVPAPIPQVITSQALATSDETNAANTFSWSTDICRSKGIFNPNAYSPQQLKDTYYLWLGFNSVMELEDVTLDSPDEWTIENIDRKSAKLDADFRKATRRLLSLQLVPSKFWETVRDLKTKELDESYALKKLTIEAYKTPGILLNQPYAKNCQAYVNALASEDSVALFNAWKNLMEEQKKNNGAPERVEAEFYRKRNSPERLLYAKIELMAFGWWNCANHQTKYNNASQEMPMEEEFDKLFLKITDECDDVD